MRTTQHPDQSKRRTTDSAVTRTRHLIHVYIQEFFKYSRELGDPFLEKTPDVGATTSSHQKKRFAGRSNMHIDRRDHGDTYLLANDHEPINTHWDIFPIYLTLSMVYRDGIARNQPDTSHLSPKQ